MVTHKLRGSVGPLADFLILVVIGLIVLVGASTFMAGFLTHYGETSTNLPQETGLMQGASDLNASVNRIADNLRESEAAGEASYITLFSGGFEALKQIPNIMTAIQNMLSGIGVFLGGFGIGWVFDLLRIALVVFIAFAFLRIVLGRST